MRGMNMRKNSRVLILDFGGQYNLLIARRVRENNVYCEVIPYKKALAERYANENSDPINAAKNGYVDNIIEPQFVRQYLIASLQMLLK